MNILSRSYIFYHGQNSFYYLFFFFSFHSLSLHGELLARQQQPGVLFGVTFQPAIEQPRGRHPSPRPLDVFTMNPYLPGCQCDIYVTRYCVSERVIEIFLAERASIPLAESAWAYRSAAAHTHARARMRGIILVRQVYRRDTKRSSDLHAARFSTDKISPLAKFIREHDPCTIRVQAFSSGRKKSQRFFLSGISMESKKGKAPLFLGFILHFSF